MSALTSSFQDFHLNADGSSRIHVGNNIYPSSAPTNNIEKCLRSLWFEEIHFKRESMNSETEGTCNWIIEHPSYTNWIRSSRALLWIRGAPGAGKSTLMKFIISQPDQTQQSKRNKAASQIILSHFFRRDGSDLESSLEGMARSLLRQLLQAYPTHLKVLLEDFTQKAVGMDLEKEKVKWGARRLLQLLGSSICEVRAVADVRIFIDAVDECNERGARDFLKMFQRITMLKFRKKGSSIKHQLAVCYSCRDDAFINYDSNPSIEVGLQNHGDICKYVQDAFLERDLSLSSNDTQVLIDLIDERANGIFLWVTLVVEQMIRDIEQRMSIEQVVARSSQLPAELTDLYRQIILRLKKEHVAQSLNLFQWACCWEVPGAQLDSMSTEYGFMHTVSTDRAHFSLGSLRAFMNCRSRTEASAAGEEKRSHFTDIDNDEMMKYQIKKLSGGLACPTDGVPLVHLSVRDFLLDEGFKILDSTLKRPVLGTIHARLAETCVSFLVTVVSNRSIIKPQVTPGGKGRSSSYVPKPMKDPVKYALTHAFAHASRSDKELHNGYFLTNFVNHLNPLLEREAAWIKLLEQELGDVLARIYSFAANSSYIPRSEGMSKDKNISSLPTTVARPNGVLHSFLHKGKGLFSLLATLYNLGRVLEEIIPVEAKSFHHLNQANERDAYNEMLHHLMAMAAEEGFESVVGTLLDNGVGRRSNRRPSHLENPLLLAAKNNHNAIVQLLARWYLDEETLCILISRSISFIMCASLSINVDVNNKNNSALIAAVEAGRTDILKLFHRRGADFNAKGSTTGGEGSSALSPLEAAINGGCDYNVVRTLLECGADVGYSRPGGNSHIIEYTRECIRQACATDGTREKRWPDFEALQSSGTDTDDAVEDFVRKREQVLPLLQNATRPLQPTRQSVEEHSRDDEEYSGDDEEYSGDDREQQHQQAVNQPDKRGRGLREMVKGFFKARKHRHG